MSATTTYNGNDTFHGWAASAKGAPLVLQEMTLKQWTEDDVEIKISHCGMCGSDDHYLCESWGPSTYPCVVGHEIVGTVTRVGKNVKYVKVGDRAGVGAQSGACQRCENCLTGNPNTCSDLKGFILTYGSRWPCGTPSYGGYADKWRGDQHFVFKVPDNMTNEIAATFFCAGITTYAPLKRTDVKAHSVVGVMGIGGLGHYGVLWAKAMGAKVIGMSHSDKKRDVALELGCDDYIVTSDKEDRKRYFKKMTHILCTGTSPDFQWEPYFDLLKVNGHFINVSLPKWDFPPFHTYDILKNQVFIHGSAIGSPNEIREMLKFAAEKNVRPWIQKYSMKDVNKAMENFRAGKPRFRFVLEN
ncbi:chaperonin 10-like protein [Mycotypha africana]|uniref:chaperonin 10-like protein n=1 Tax=Mycotypha africana TaxID=64632 RepID=UPI002300A733|nr:chaperonin 10-like protein [Mycotypha africana]KAI8991063.1 chaperonin 10-like protein [Mycotypha africana]